METRRTNLSHADTLRVGERGGRDVSPHSGTRRRHEEEWRRNKRDTGRMSERPQDGEPSGRGWNREREPSFTTFKRGEGQTERDRREQETPKRTNGRVVSMLEPGPVGEQEGERGKGDTFPRMRRPSKDQDRRVNIIPEDERWRRDREMDRGLGRTQERLTRVEPHRDDSRERDREMARRRDKDIQRYREEERQRERERALLIEDWKRNVQRSLEREERRRQEEARDSDPSGQERRCDRNTEGNDPRGRREMDRERGRQRQSDRPYRFYSPPRHKAMEEEGGMDRPRGGNRDRREYTREGQRDTRSEGESDGSRGNVRGIEEYVLTLEHKHSRSEGDNEGEERRARVKLRQRDRERAREEDYYRQRVREREREMGRNREGYHERDRQRAQERDAERTAEKRRDEFSGTQQRGRDDRSGREREDGRPYPRDDNVGQRRKGERPTERYSERDRKPRRPTERAREGEDRGRHSPSSAQFRPQASQSGRESTPERELERRRQPQDFKRCPPVQEEYEVPESPNAMARDRNSNEMGQDKGDQEEEREMSQTRVEQGEKGGQGPETRTLRRMWLVPGQGTPCKEGARNSLESSQEDEPPDRRRETSRETAESADESLLDKYRKLEKAGEFAGNRDTCRGSERASGSEEREGEQESESGTSDEREANITEESDREREDGSDSGDHLGSEGLSDGEILGIWRTSPSVEDGFVTVSSGGEEEENFEDCKEFLDSGSRDDSTRQSQQGYKRERGVEPWDESRTKSERDKAGTVFCVVGSKLPRKETHKRAYLDLDNLESIRGIKTDYSDLKYRNRRSLDLTGDGRTRQEPARSKDKELDEMPEYKDAGDAPNIQVAEKEPEGPLLSNEHMQGEVISSLLVQNDANFTPDANEHPPVNTDMPGSSEDYGYAVIQDRRQETKSSAEQPGGGEVNAERNLSEIWATAEEMKRYSQAPHLKWAKNVVQEILGLGEDQGLEGATEPLTEMPADPNQVPEGTVGSPAPGPMPEYATVQKRPNPPNSDSEPPPQLPPAQEDEPAQWDEPRGSVVHAGNLTHTDDMHVEREEEAHGGESETHVHGEVDTSVHVEGETGTESSTQRGMDLHTHIERKEEESSVGEGKGSGQEKVNTDSEAEATKPISQSRDSSVERETVKETGGGGGDGRTGDVGVKLRKTEKCAILSTNSFRDLGPEARQRRRGIRKTVAKHKREHEEEEVVEEEEEEEEKGGEVGRDRRTRVFASEYESEDLRFSWNEVELRKVVESIGRKKRNSKFFNSQLYQQYSEVVLNREILQQFHSDTLSVGEDVSSNLPASPCTSVQPSPAQRPLPPLPTIPHPHSIQHSSGSFSGGTSTLSLPPPAPRPPSPRVSISGQTQSLWQELPSVKNSRELEDMTEERRRLQEVRFEVVTSEASYSQSLDIVVEHFVKCKELESLLTTQDRNWLFSRLVDVRAISHSFLTKLEERVEKNTLHFDVCDIIMRHCQMFRMVYVPYLTNQSYQDKTYQRLMDENPSFKRCVERLERSPLCQRLPLRSFLILPFQRITRLKLLVQTIVKKAPPKSDDEAQAIKAMKLLEKIIQDSNDSITQMKSIESLVSLSAKVDFECKTLPLISQSRRMVREGLVTELMDFSLKENERSVYIHLFNDYLLLSLPKEGGKFTVIDHAPVAKLRAENCRVKLHSLKKNLFRLHLFKKSLLLRTDTLSDKLRWISALSSPHPEIDFTAAQDFPQMQCIRAYMAQQPDELGLEKADVLLVHQHSSDGWVEGTRMSDKHRGWAPETHLETIANEKARQRNLMDIHKITIATAAL